MAISLKKALNNYTRTDTAKVDCGGGWFIEIRPFSNSYKALSKEKAKLRTSGVVEKKGSVKLPSAKLDTNAPLFTDDDLDSDFLLGSIENDIQFFVDNILVSWDGLVDDDGQPVPSDRLIQRTINDRQSPYTSGSTTYYPGAAYSYSNVGFVVLHRIVEVVSGKDYESFLKEDVLARMGITDTHIGGYQNERRDNECIFYAQGGGDGYKNPLRELAGAAGIITSTNQMMRILTFMDGDDTVPDIFSYETLQEMYTPYKYSASDYKRYGLGWRMNHSRLFPGSHYHGGNIAGTATLWVGNTDQHMSGAFVCNSRAYNSNSNGDIDDNMYILLDEFLNYFNY